ncbi:MAG: leucyl aminopeptidase [Proteobacteria bacterium]|nr:leucyl aminopeptidase [Pseudomonadota bacterium]
MKITSSLVTPSKSKSDALFIGFFSDTRLNKIAQEADTLLNGQISSLQKSKDFQAKVGEVLTLFSASGQRIVLVGLGKQDKCNLGTLQTASAHAVKAVVTTPVKTVSNYITSLKFNDINTAVAGKIISIAASHATYRYDTTKVFKKDNQHSLSSMVIYANKKDATIIKQASCIALGVEVTRELGNLPPNICTPAYLANHAKDIAKKYKNCTLTILDEKKMQKLKMDSLLAVARGSRNSPKMVVLKYTGAKKSQKPHIIVGKGVTFDTGGISLKPSAGMDEMKYDMCGAAAVFGIFVAVTEMQLPINLIMIVPAVENMPDGDAYRPGDVITSYAGKTIEVLNTDAEGRMILCDALTYAQEYKPQVLIDVATLTGSCVIALGHVASAVMSKQTQLPQDIINAGQQINDKAWQMPLWDEYQKQIDTPFADMQNTGGLPAGSITAGCFLSRFCTDANWAHIDIAGTAWNNKQEGATGRPVAMMAQYLINESKK